MYFGKTPFVGKNVKKPWWEIWADEGGFTCVIDILLRIPPPSSSFWILYFTLGYHICTQWGQQVESSMFPNEARDRGRAKYPPIWSYWAFYHLFNKHLTTFMAHNMGDYLCMEPCEPFSNNEMLESTKKRNNFTLSLLLGCPSSFRPGWKQ